jgi:hypothetical protein
MATFIKVEQGGSELLRRNQEQAQAARLDKLEGDERARVEREARRIRRDALAQQGLDSNGNAIGDSRRRQVFRRDEPAASLLQRTKLGHLWIWSKTEGDNQNLINTFASGTGSQALKKDKATNYPSGLTSQFDLVEARTDYSYGMTLNHHTTQFVNGYSIQGYESCYGTVQGIPITGSVPLYSTGFIEIPLHKIITKTFNANNSHLVLPAGGDACIVIHRLKSHWSYWYRDSVSKQSSFPETALRYTTPVSSEIDEFSAFIVSANSCRQVALPQRLLQVLSVIWPPYVTETESREYLPTSYSSYTIQPSSGCPPFESPFRSLIAYVELGYPPVDQSIGNDQWCPWSRPRYDIAYGTSQQFTYPVRRAPSSPSYEPAKYKGLKASGAVTPSIFASLNQAAQFVSPSFIKDFPAGRRWITEAGDFQNGTQQYGFYSMPGDPDEVAGGSVVPNSRLTFSLADQLHPDFVTDPGYSVGKYTIWDWDDPNYCRSMCLALGFNTADLQP